MIRQDRVARARSLFVEDKLGPYLAGRFASLYGDLILAQSDDLRCGQIADLSTYIVWDIWNVSVLIERLQWLQARAVESHALQERWFWYVGVDIEHFHVQLRAALDYAAKIAYRAADRPDHVRGNGIDRPSFNELREWLQNERNKERNREALGVDLADVVSDATWFLDVKDVRDAALHRGAVTLAFGSPADGILFNVLGSGMQRIAKQHEALLWNPNVLDFKLYAANYMAELLCFLEDLASVVVKQLGREHDPEHKAQNYSGGFGTVVEWMGLLQAKLQDVNA